MTAFSLKLIAVAAMLIDHIGYLFLPSGSLQSIFRSIGRIAFPIFCFLVAEGYLHTRSLNKYILRLSVFAVISEIPFDLALRDSLYDINRQNVFFTLLTGLVLISVIDLIFKAAKNGKNKLTSSFFAHLSSALTLVAALAASVLLRSDYAVIGVLSILAFYLFRRRLPAALFAAVTVNLVFGGLNQLPSVYSAVPLMLYNGKKGPSVRWMFYFFYPVHLLALYIIKTVFFI